MANNSSHDHHFPSSTHVNRGYFDRRLFDNRSSSYHDIGRNKSFFHEACYSSSMSDMYDSSVNGGFAGSHRGDLKGIGYTPYNEEYLHGDPTHPVRNKLDWQHTGFEPESRDRRPRHTRVGISVVTSNVTTMLLLRN